MRFINALVACSVIAITSSSVMAQSTAVQWTTASGGNGHWYSVRVFTSELTPSEYFDLATAIGGYGASITNQAEDEFVYQLSVATPGGWSVCGLGPLLGGGRLSGCNFTWLTGEPWGYTSWGPADPSHCGEQYLQYCVCGQSSECARRWWIDTDMTVKPSGVIEWSADCNNDGIVDYGQILSGELIDANSNGIPDCCESGTACDGNLIQNGGLEGGSYSACNGFNILSAGSTVIPGWTIGPNGIDWIWSLSSGPCCDWAPQGDRTIDLNGSPSQNGGAIRQTIQTQPGKHYKFSMRGLSNACCSEVGGQKIMRLTLGSSSSEYVFITLGGPSPECDSMNWTRVERTWVATATDSLIELKSLVPNSAGGIIVDDISVIELDPCPGDINLNSVVDAVDLAMVLTSWGTSGSEYPRADVNHDGVVNGPDLGALLGGWGLCP